MRRRTVLFLLALLAFITSSAQDLDGNSIALKATTSVSGEEFLINVQCKGDSIWFVYKVKDSTSSKLAQDPAYRSLTESLLSVSRDREVVKQSALVYTAKLDSLRQSYTFYSSGSLTFHKADNREYSQLLSRLFASSSEVLENKEAAGNRIVVDGTRMAFDITTKDASRTVYAHSPSPASHPLLYTFVHETLNLFRQRNSSSLYSQQRTNGY